MGWREKLQEGVQGAASAVQAAREEHPGALAEGSALQSDRFDDVDFDKNEQLEKTQADLIPGEILYAVYDMKGGGTGFVGITDRRLIVQDHAFLRKTKSMVSIPFSKVSAIAAEDSGKIVFGTSKLTICAGNQTYDFEFRSNEKAHRAYRLILQQTLQGEIAR